MKKLIIAILAVICIFWQCSPCRHCPVVNTPAVESYDSVRVEYRDRIVHDTVEFQVPDFFEKHETPDTLSVIENDYARTAAVVHDGILSHDLKVKPKVIEVPVAYTVTDTLIVHDKADTIVKTVEVERDFTWKQLFLMRFGKIALCLMIIAALIFGAKLILRKLAHTT